MTDSPSLVLSGSPHRWVWVALGCGLCAAIGLTVALSGHYTVIAWAVTAFFAWLLVMAVRQTRRLDHLVLHDDSFDVLFMGETVTRDFASCSEFGVWSEGSNSLVIFDHPHDDAGPNAAANRAITGRAGSLPHRFGVRADELAALMNMARARALGAEDTSEPDPE